MYFGNSSMHIIIMWSRSVMAVKETTIALLGHDHYMRGLDSAYPYCVIILLVFWYIGPGNDSIWTGWNRVFG